MMRHRAVLGVLAGAIAGLGLAACGHVPEPAASQPAAVGGSGAAGPAAMPAPAADPTEPPSEAVQNERLAAIQKAMNELDAAAQQCWAAAATERFDIAGELALQIDIAPGTSHAAVVRDTAHNPALAACVVQLMAGYRWAPPLYGQSIQLPFKFRAPDGQSTIDRALVAWNGQGQGAARVSVAVLLDENNTGNAAASMVELAIAGGGTTGLRWADRAELWYFLGAGEVRSVAGGTHRVAAGDMMYAPLGAAREVAATAGDLHAMIVFVPGGREGAARGGALPTREVTGVLSAPLSPVVLPASGARTFGPATIFVDGSVIPGAVLAADVLTARAGAQIPEHVHAGETELLYVLAGSGTMTVGGVSLPVTPTTVVQVPKATRHSFTAATDLRAVQIYTPGGPEQRFKAHP
ncbi:MAG TPA: cupin domain-containing protein [Kofleriaceae bacterium]|jgi:quercetin dioxygenase-like cupin family protein|nr:cupin domain-containing protein [Kofleriaceae bacterium]